MLTFDLVITDVTEPALSSFYWKITASSDNGTWVTYVNKDEIRYFSINDEFSLFKWRWLRKLYHNVMAFDTYPSHFWWEKEKGKK